MKRFPLALLLSLTVVGCSPEARTFQFSMENTLPEGGPKIEYDPESSFTNIEQVSASLNTVHADKFNTLLGWYGTESHFGLERLAGKTAREVVDIVNCIQEAEQKEQQAACFE